MMHERAYCRDEAASHHLPIAAAFWIIQIVSTEEYSSLMQNLMQIRFSTRSVILCVIAVQYYMLTQQHLPPPLTSTLRSSLFLYVHYKIYYKIFDYKIISM